MEREKRIEKWRKGDCASWGKWREDEEGSWEGVLHHRAGPLPAECGGLLQPLLQPPDGFGGEGYGKLDSHFLGNRLTNFGNLITKIPVQPIAPLTINHCFYNSYKHITRPAP